MSHTSRIAIIGGTGKLGHAIAGRLAAAGVSVTIGSRSKESAQEAAAQLPGEVSGMDNAAAAAAADEIVILAVPFAAHETTLAEIGPGLAGKILVDTTVPLAPPKVMRVQMPPAGCAAIETRAAVAEDVIVVSAFHNVAAHRLAEHGPIACDVLVFGDDKDARQKVVDLARLMGLKGLHAGALVNSVAAEALTSILIFINKTYGADGAGLQITGLPEA